MRVRTVVTALAAVAGLSAAWWQGALPCSVLVTQPDCQLLVTGGPVLETAELVRVTGAGPLREPAGRILATTIEVAEPLDRHDWWSAHRDPDVDVVARDRFIPRGQGLADVAQQGQVRMLESQQSAAAIGLHRAGRIPSVETPSGLWPVTVDFATDGVGGPSAGLMLALAVYARAAPLDPTARAAELGGPLVVAGTGALATDGRVLAVGGVDHKLRSVTVGPANAPLPDVFLLPVADLPAARRVDVAHGILLVPVADVDAAIAALEDVRAGRRPPGSEPLGPARSAGR